MPHQTRLCPGIVLCGRIKGRDSPLNGGMEDSQDSGGGSMGAYGPWVAYEPVMAYEALGTYEPIL